MSKKMILTHYYHSGFSLETDKILLVFDYWRGEENELKLKKQLTDEKLAAYERIVVFISHDHIDHFDPVVFEWREKYPVNYIISSDMPAGIRGTRLAPGEIMDLGDHIRVKAYPSTDLGVSYMVEMKGTCIFHAGDLNFWHWREESNAREIDEAEEEFRNAVEVIKNERIDLAMFPVDPRQGSMYDAGANYFILTVKPRLLIPMHYFHRGDVAMEFARRARCRTTEVIAMPGYGDRIELVFEEDGYINVHFLAEETKVNKTEQEIKETNQKNEENDPFSESDLPVTLNNDLSE